MMREQYLRQAASLRRTGHEELAVQFKNLFKLRAPYVEARISIFKCRTYPRTAGTTGFVAY
jgi:hypothetical protein